MNLIGPSLRRSIISGSVINNSLHKCHPCQIFPVVASVKPAELKALMFAAPFQVNRLNSGSARRSHHIPRPRQVWDCDIYPIPTLPHSSLSFSQSKNKSVCLLCNREEVKSVVCARHAPKPEPHWFRTHPHHRHM